MFNDCCEYNNDVTRPTGLVNAPAVRVNFLPLKVSGQSKTIRYVIGYWSFRVFFDHGIIQRSCSHGFCAFSRERKPRLRFFLKDIHLDSESRRFISRNLRKRGCRIAEADNSTNARHRDIRSLRRKSKKLQRKKIRKTGIFDLRSIAYQFFRAKYLFIVSY